MTIPHSQNPINLIHYAEIPHKIKSYGLAIGLIEKTNVLYIERYVETFEGRFKIKSLTFRNNFINNIKTSPHSLKDFYITMLNNGYNTNIAIRRALEALVYDFSCITKAKTL